MINIETPFSHYLLGSYFKSGVPRQNSRELNEHWRIAHPDQFTPVTLLLLIPLFYPFAFSVLSRHQALIPNLRHEARQNFRVIFRFFCFGSSIELHWSLTQNTLTTRNIKTLFCRSLLLTRDRNFSTIFFSFCCRPLFLFSLTKLQGHVEI